MITETKEIYKCEFCKKLYQVRHFAVLHEKRCFRNPNNDRACFGCLRLTKKETTIIKDGYNGEYEETVNLCYCIVKDIYLYPPQVEQKENAIELDEESNEPMPRTCSSRKISEAI